MKRLLLSYFLLAMPLSLPQANAAIVNAGDTLALQFSEVPLVASNYLGIGPQVTFNFGNLDPFGAGDAFTVDYFSDSVSATPDRSITYTGTSTSSNHFTQNLAPEINNPVLLNWNSDHQGAMKLTMVSGSIDMQSTKVEIWDGTNYYSGNYQFGITPVPVPSAFILMLCALTTFMPLARSKHR